MIDANDKRFWLWVGKWVFPEIDTKRTKLQYVPETYHSVYMPKPEPLTWRNNPVALDVMKPMEILRVDMNKFGYKSKWRYRGGIKHCFTVRFGYCKELDTLLVVKDSYRIIDT